jgi:hypothetical protein
MTYEFWHDFAGPLATVIASIVAVIVTIHLGRSQARIAQEQARIARQQADLAVIRLRHDLYDRRFALYTSAISLLQRIIQKNNVDDLDIVTFLRETETATAQFLLDQNLVEYFNSLWENARRMQRLNRRIEHEKNDEVRAKLFDDFMEISDWFESQFQVLPEKFLPFLTLKNIDKD